MITLRTVGKKFEDVKSLNNVNLTVGDGSIFGLIGSNGSGKSTLLRILSGIYREDEGEVLYDGKGVWDDPQVKKNIVYLSDDQYFLPHATVRDMMHLYSSLYPSFSREKYKKLLGIFNLDEKRKISTFSKGMKKQVQVLLGISCGTEYLFLDETFDGLDPVMRQCVRKIIASDVAERRLTVILASHNIKEIENICDHFALLHKGEIIIESDLDDMKTELHKVQITFRQEDADHAELLLSKQEGWKTARRGSLFTVIAKGNSDTVKEKLDEMKPSFIEFIPLTLEEIFLSEMEEHGYDVDEHFN